VKVTREKTENSQAFLTIEMDPNEIEGYMEKAYRRIVLKANVPGFRKGKAPRTVVERLFGKAGLLEEAVNILIPVEYEKAVKQENLEPVGQPEIQLEKIEPVTFKAVVPLPPTITLGDYTQVRVTPETVNVTEDKIDNVIEHFRHRSATWEPVDRPVVTGDLVTISITSDVEGKPFLSQDGLQYHVESASTFPAPGFGEQITGLKRDEEKEFKLKLPDDFYNKEFGGKEVAFKVVIKEIKVEKLPEVTDEFVKIVSPDSKDLADLRQRINTEIKTEMENKSHSDFEDKVLQAVVDASKIEYPPVFVEREMDQLMDRQLQYMQMGPREFQEYLKSVNKTGEQVREDLRPMAVKRVTRSLILDKVAEAEKIEVSDSEIDAEALKMAETAGEHKEEYLKSFANPSARDYIKEVLTTRKAIAKLEEIAKTENTAVPAAEAAVEPPKEEVKSE
jgi:trigger factor